MTLPPDAAAATPPRGRGRLRPRWLLTGAGLVLLAILFARLGPDRIVDLIETMGANIFVVVALFAAHEAVRALAVQRCLPVEAQPPLWRLFRVRLLGEAAGTLTNTGSWLSEPARAWLLGRQGPRAEEAYAAAIGELLLNSCVSAVVTVAVLAWSASGVLHGGSLGAYARVLKWGSIGYIVLVGVALFGRVPVLSTAWRGLAALPGLGRRLRARTRVEDVRSLERRLHEVVARRGALLAVLVLELAAQGLIVSEVYWSILSMGVPVSFGTALRIEALTKLTNLVQVVGAAEGGYALVFTWLGVPAVTGFTLSIVRRVRSLVAAAAGLGLMTLSGRSSTAVCRAPSSP